MLMRGRESESSLSSSTWSISTSWSIARPWSTISIETGPSLLQGLLQKSNFATLINGSENEFYTNSELRFFADITAIMIAEFIVEIRAYCRDQTF